MQQGKLVGFYLRDFMGATYNVRRDQQDSLGKMNEFTVVSCIVVAIFCAAHMARPVSRAEKAHLLVLAMGDPECEEIADKVVARKWLAWTQYDAAKQAIARIKAKREHDQMLAESAARQVVRDAQRRV